MTKPRVDANALRGLSLLRTADEPLLGAIAGSLVEERRGADEDLYKEGDAGEKFYIIVKGKVEIATTDAHGEKLRLALYGDGDFFGETALLNDWRHTTTAQTLTPSVFLTLDRARFRALLDSSPELRANFDALVRQREESPAKQNESGEAGIDIASYNVGEEPELQRTFVDYDEIPRQYQLQTIQTVIRLHTRITDLYNNVYDQLREQLRLTIQGIKEREEVRNSQRPRARPALSPPRLRCAFGPAPARRLPTTWTICWRTSGRSPRSSLLIRGRSPLSGANALGAAFRLRPCRCSARRSSPGAAFRSSRRTSCRSTLGRVPHVPIATPRFRPDRASC